MADKTFPTGPSLTGQLLIAAPSLKDPNFDRTVVLLVAHEPGGAIGVVLNRATEIAVEDVLDGWQHLATDPGVLFEGGPVAPDSAICLARMLPDAPETRCIQRINRQVGTVDLSGDPRKLATVVQGVRVFAGYSGWEPGQLEDEIEAGCWFVIDALPGDPLAPRPDDLWPTVLRRQGGLMAAVAYFPADPALN